MSGEMRAEATNDDNNDADMRENEVEVGPGQVDISGSPAKEPEEEIVFASRAATPSERTLRTPQRTPARKRRTEINDSTSHKRLSMDFEDDFASRMTIPRERR